MLDEGVESRSDGVHRIHWKRIDSDGKTPFSILPSYTLITFHSPSSAFIYAHYLSFSFICLHLPPLAFILLYLPSFTLTTFHSP